MNNFKNRKQKIDFLKGLANGTRSANELVKPITGIWIIGTDTCIYNGLDGKEEITRTEYDRIKQLNETL